jgi:hypothetical protein
MFYLFAFMFLEPRVIKENSAEAENSTHEKAKEYDRDEGISQKVAQ